MTNINTIELASVINGLSAEARTELVELLGVTELVATPVKKSGRVNKVVTDIADAEIVSEEVEMKSRATTNDGRNAKQFISDCGFEMSTKDIIAAAAEVGLELKFNTANTTRSQLRKAAGLTRSKSEEVTVEKVTSSRATTSDGRNAKQFISDCGFEMSTKDIIVKAAEVGLQLKETTVNSTRSQLRKAAGLTRSKSEEVTVEKVTSSRATTSDGRNAKQFISDCGFEMSTKDIIAAAAEVGLELNINTTNTTRSLLRKAAGLTRPSKNVTETVEAQVDAEEAVSSEETVDVQAPELVVKAVFNEAGDVIGYTE